MHGEVPHPLQRLWVLVPLSQWDTGGLLPPTEFLTLPELKRSLLNGNI